MMLLLLLPSQYEQSIGTVKLRIASKVYDLLWRSYYRLWLRIINRVYKKIFTQEMEGRDEEEDPGKDGERK